MAELRKYNIETKIYFPLITRGSTDFDTTIDTSAVTFIEGDIQISRNGNPFTNTIEFPEHIGNGIYELVLKNSEMKTPYAVVTIIDQDNPKEWEDQAILIDTFGNISAALELYDLPFHSPFKKVWCCFIIVLIRKNSCLITLYLNTLDTVPTF